MSSPSAAEIQLTIDGRAVSVPPGTTIFDRQDASYRASVLPADVAAHRDGVASATLEELGAQRPLVEDELDVEGRLGGAVDVCH